MEKINTTLHCSSIDELENILDLLAEGECYFASIHWRGNIELLTNWNVKQMFNELWLVYIISNHPGTEPLEVVLFSPDKTAKTTIEVKRL